MAIPWTAEETALLKDCNSRQEARQRYLERFPDIPRLPATVGRRFYDVCPDKRDPKWTDLEKVPIQTAETIECAIAEYQKLFPLSTRSLAAIRREWYDLRPEKRYLISCGRKKGGRNKAPHKGSAREKYHIPFSTKQDKKGYNHAVYVCEKFELPYAEAIEFEKQEALFKLQERTIPREKPLQVREQPVLPDRGLMRSLFKLQEKTVKQEKPPRKIRVRVPRPMQEKPVRPEPELIRCARCGSPISPADFEYTEKTGLCIPCWEETDVVEDMVVNMAEPARVIA